MPGKGSDTLWWDEDLEAVCLIDQTALPSTFRVITCPDVPRLITAIKHLEVRGAPALGVAGALGVALAARHARGSDPESARSDIEGWARTASAPRARTAVNLARGTDRVCRAATRQESAEAMYIAALQEARAIADEDLLSCRALGDAGTDLLPARGQS